MERKLDLSAPAWAVRLDEILAQFIGGFVFVMALVAVPFVVFGLTLIPAQVYFDLFMIFVVLLGLACAAGVAVYVLHMFNIGFGS